MKPIRSFVVRPALPPRLAPLEELAYNLRWSWDHATIDLFRRLDRDLWEESRHNPARMLGTLPQERLHEAAEDDAFLAYMERVHGRLRDYLAASSTWYRKTFGAAERPETAYFSMEFGLTECMPIYSGGLGILAGDHLKAASDLGVPLVGVGILYQKGYFRQYLTPEGWQQERYPVNDFHNMPLRPFRDEKGDAVTVEVEVGGTPVRVALWEVRVGRVTLVLLDTNIPPNPQDLQDITDELYGGDLERRIQQEIILGIGGMRALERLGLRARVYHMNEGHCAFLSLERIARLMRDENLSFDEAREIAATSAVFTTHTPVPAGIDVFPPDLVDRYFHGYRQQLGVDREKLLDLGRAHPGDKEEPFNMAVLAIRTTCMVNGVSRLHGRVARGMWRDVWPGLPLQEVPIGHVTNGIHPQSWISEEMASLFERYLGPRWAEEPADAKVWQRVEQIPGEELWRTHERRRERMVSFARKRLARQLRERGAGTAAIEETENILDPEALTIGFARRFATYKRALLILRDPERLARILNGSGRPVQIIFAGKAHPRDDEGKALIRQIVQLASQPEFRRRIAFLEDYDMTVSRYLVEGVDVWLNTPRRPMEASGTSGMKAAFNGALNLSIPDGWWDEAWSPRTGWVIGRGESYQDRDYQDRVESGILYDLLEREIVPLFYDRSGNGLPRGWIALMKTAGTDLCPIFNTNRMVQQYVTEAYHPARTHREHLEENGCRRARDLAAWRRRVLGDAWDAVRILEVQATVPEPLRVGATFEVRARIAPGKLGPEDLAVQAYAGRVDDRQEIVEGEVIPMELVPGAGGDGFLFHGKVRCDRSGLRGVTVRVLPHHPDLFNPYCPARILWAE